MNLIHVNKENINQEHICCCLSNAEADPCVDSKKAWMKERFEDGLVFTKLAVRGKVFIEYIPAEAAWSPIQADGYIHINCFWVSGQYTKQGFGKQLLQSCIEDAKAKGKVGITVLSSSKKLPFLSDPKFLKYQGFQVADTIGEYELLYLPFSKGAMKPIFQMSAKKGEIEEQGMVLYYTAQCPFNEKYAPQLKQWANKLGTDVTLIKITSTTQAQQAPTPCPTYSFFHHGKFVTNEIFSEKKFNKYIEAQ